MPFALLSLATGCKTAKANSNISIPQVPQDIVQRLMTHPQIEANNLFQLINSASQGKVRALRYPTKFDGNEMFNGKPAPALGEHKKEIIESLSN